MENKYHTERLIAAKELADKLKDFTLGIYLVGSVAYNPHAVTSNSDVDIIAIINFNKLELDKLNDIFNNQLDKNAINLALNGEIDMFDFKSDSNGIKIAIYFRTKEAFDRLCSFKGLVKRFTSNNRGLPLNCIFRSLRGEEITIDEHQDITNGRIFNTYSIFENEKDIFISVQATNILLNPVPLYNDNLLREGFDDFIKNLHSKMIAKYKNINRKEANLTKAIPSELLAKLPEDLRTKLETFF